MRSFFDQQSMLRNWVAPNIPGATAAQVEDYASPVYQTPKNGRSTKTAKTLPPVKVVRWKLDSPAFALNLGELAKGVHAVRVIAAVEEKQLHPFRRPIYLRMKVNDGLGGEVRQYRVRIGYCDEFYSVAELYFNAPGPGKRSFQAELTVDHGSQADLLVHNVTLDDVLAGAVRRPIKRHGCLYGLAPSLRSRSRRRSPSRRSARQVDWPATRPSGTPSRTSTPNAARSAPGVTNTRFPERDQRRAGQDRPADRRRVRPLGPGRRRRQLPGQQEAQAQRTVADFHRHAPLPDPYPYKDDGAAVLSRPRRSRT